MNFSSIPWKVILDQLHNIVIAGTAIVGALGFSTVIGNDIVGYLGIAGAVLTSILSGSNVNAAVNQAPPASVVPNAAA